jgi:hypothetical protein
MAGLVCDFVGAAVLIWPAVWGPRGGFETMEYLRSPQSRCAAALVLLGFIAQGIGAYLGGR